MPRSGSEWFLAALSIIVLVVIFASLPFRQVAIQGTLEERVASLEARVSALEGTPAPTATARPTVVSSATPTGKQLCDTCDTEGTKDGSGHICHKCSDGQLRYVREVSPNGDCQNCVNAVTPGAPTATGAATSMVTATPKPTWTPGSISPTPTKAATLAVVTPTRAPTASAQSGGELPPVLFVMLDWFNGNWGNADYRYSYLDVYGHRQDYTGHPEFGALGGWAEFHWCDLNPGLNVYDWGKTDAYIKAAQTMRVTLPDGSMIQKPVGLAVVVWTADQDANRIGMCWMPTWVIAEEGGSTMSCKSVTGCKPFCSPSWVKTKWQARYDQFVAAMGQHYDGNAEFKNLSWLAVMTGVDGEVVASKTIGGCDYGTGDAPGFGAWCLRAQAAYAKAFPHIPSFIQPTVHNSGTFAQSATGLAGIKVNGLEPDVSSAELRLNDVLVGGVTGFAEANPSVLAGFEPKRDNGTEGSYWFFMQGLSVHPSLFDVQLQNIKQAYLCEQMTGFPILDFTREHLGKTVLDTPDVWIVERDTVWEDTTYTGSDGVKRTYGPHHGDFEYWLYERTEFPGSHTVTRNGDEKYAEVTAAAIKHPYGFFTVKRTDLASGNRWFTFDIDDRYVTRFGAAWTVTATVLNMGGSDLSMQYRDVLGKLQQRTVTRGPGLGAVGTWVDVAFVLTDAKFDNSLPGDFRFEAIGTDLYIHRVIVRSGQVTPASAHAASVDRSALERGGWSD